MEKQLHRIHGFIDVGSARVGSQMLFVDDNGQWRRTSEIINAQVAGGKVLVETENSIYANYDVVLERNQNGFRSPREDELLPQKSVAQALAEKYCNSDKQKYTILECDPSSFRAFDYANEKWDPISVENIKPGMRIHFGYCLMQDVEDVENVRSFSVHMQQVQDCVFKDGVFCVESQGAVFSNIDFSRELAELKMEHVNSRSQDEGLIVK